MASKLPLKLTDLGSGQGKLEEFASGDTIDPACLPPAISGSRNKIINGNFPVNQLALSGTVVLAAGAYGHDMWKAGSAGCTYTFSTTANITTLTITAGSLQHIIEGNNLQSGTHTLSWAGTAQGKIGAGSYSTSGVAGAVTGGSNLTLEFNAGTLALAQLESGAVATPFEHRLLGVELGLCQRYYNAIYSTVRTYLAANRQFSDVAIYWPAMRATPTIALGAAEGAYNAWSESVSAKSPNSGRYEVQGDLAGDAYIINRLLLLSARL